MTDRTKVAALKVKQLARECTCVKGQVRESWHQDGVQWKGRITVWRGTRAERQEVGCPAARAQAAMPSLPRSPKASGANSALSVMNWSQILTCHHILTRKSLRVWSLRCQEKTYTLKCVHIYLFLCV